MDMARTIDVHDEPLLVHALRYFPDGDIKPATDFIQKESLLKIRIDGTLFMQLVCSPNRLPELVVGRLFSEGIISDIKDVNQVIIKQSPLEADVRLERPYIRSGHEASKTTPTFSSTNVLMDEAAFSGGNSLQRVTPIHWDPAWIFNVAEVFGMDRTAHRVTRGAHSTYLATPDAMVCCCEDIGRHNAFDKVIGYAMMHDVDLSGCLVFLSGRVPVDMIVKAVGARVPIVVSKAVPTDKAINIARRCDMTLICSATSKSMDVLNDPLRVK